MRFDIKTLTEHVIDAYKLSMEYIDLGKREIALIQYGRGEAYINVLSMIVGNVHDFNSEITTLHDKAWIKLHARRNEV